MNDKITKVTPEFLDAHRDPEATWDDPIVLEMPPPADNLDAQSD